LVRRILSVVTAIILFGVFWSPAVSYADTNDSFTITGLTQYTTSDTRFTVNVTGADTVCSMSFGLQWDTKAPYVFTMHATGQEAYEDGVSVHLCNNTNVFLSLGTTIPFEMKELPTFGSLGPNATEVSLQNNLMESATVTVSNPSGEILATDTLPASELSTVAFDVDRAAPVQYFQATITSQSGITMNFPFPVADRWGLLGTNFSPTFSPCSTIQWAYNPKGAPAKVSQKKIVADILGAFKRLSAITGLQFKQVTTPGLPGQPNVITLDWVFDRTAHANTAAAYGGFGWNEDLRLPYGEIHLNAKNWWPSNDKYSGFGYYKTQKIAGRGWMFTHELMHVLGLSHSKDPKQLMYFMIQKQVTFGDADQAALKALYTPTLCTAN
jgi:Matrixin